MRNNNTHNIGSKWDFICEMKQGKLEMDVEGLEERKFVSARDGWSRGAKEKGRGFGKSWENSNRPHRRFQASSDNTTLQF